jgi:hypothetical protein
LAVLALLNQTMAVILLVWKQKQDKTAKQRHTPLMEQNHGELSNQNIQEAIVAISTDSIPFN